MNNEDYILALYVVTPDGHYMQVKHRYDYQSYTDTLTGETYMADGLGWYYRSSVNLVPATFNMITLKSDHKYARDYVLWGTRGKDRALSLEYVPVSLLETEHISAILATQKQIAEALRIFFERELAYRKQENLP